MCQTPTIIYISSTLNTIDIWFYVIPLYQLEHNISSIIIMITDRCYICEGNASDRN